MEYRLIRHAVTGETLVIGADGYLSGPLGGAQYLTTDAELRADWWRVRREEYNTALWQHPLWAVLAKSPGGWWEPRPTARPRPPEREARRPLVGLFPLEPWGGDGQHAAETAGE